MVSPSSFTGMRRRGDLSSEPSTKPDVPGSTSISETSSNGLDSLDKWVELPPQFRSIIAEIKQCLRFRLYYSALVITLTIPEVCVGLTFDVDNPIKRKHYREFIDRYAIKNDLMLDGDNCYNMRCGMVHRGNAVAHVKSRDQKVDKILFTVPKNQIVFHGFRFETDRVKALCYDLNLFVEAMTDALWRWYCDNKSKRIVQENISNIMSFRANGLSPFFTEDSPEVGVIASGALLW